MIILRDEYKQQLAKNKTDIFIEKMVGLFQEKDKFHANAIGEGGVRKVVELGLEKADRYGLNRESPVQTYIHLMFYLGSHFDVDPLLPWASKTLKSKKYGGAQVNKANALREEFLVYLEIVSGQNGEYLQGFMEACLSQIGASKIIENQSEIADFLKIHYPQKFDYVGVKKVDGLIIDSQERLIKSGLNDMRSVMVLVILRFIYGVGVTDDPLFPWVRNTLKSDKNNKDELFLKIYSGFINRVHRYIKGE